MTGLTADHQVGDPFHVDGHNSIESTLATKADLVDGKIPPSQMPAVGITTVYVVGSQAAMLALAARSGDFAERTDESETYVLQGTDPTVASNWVKLLHPVGGLDKTTADGLYDPLGAAQARYTLPTGGVPKSDLTVAVQTSLTAADQAIPTSQRAIASGVATLGSDGKLVPAQTPTISGVTEHPKVYAVGGNGTDADFTAAYQQCMSEVAYVGSDLCVRGDIVLPDGALTFTTERLFLDSPATSTSTRNDAKIIFGYRIRGGGKRRTTVTFNSAAAATNDPRVGNLMLAANRLRKARFSDMTVKSSNANQSLLYMWCASNASLVTSQFQEYGVGAQNSLLFDRVEFAGPWKSIVQTDGPATYNQNSEITFRDCETTNDATFSRGVLSTGYPVQADWNVAPASQRYNVQQAQGLNYLFDNCNFEYASGHVLYLAVGGVVQIRGKSWINGINSGVGSSFIYIPKVVTVAADGVTTQPIPYSVKNLDVDDVRFELRDPTSSVIDCPGWTGSSAHVSFRNILVANDFIPSASKATQQVFHFGDGTGTSHATVGIEDSELCGQIYVDLSGAAPANQNTIAVKRSNFREYVTVNGTPAPGMNTTGRPVKINAGAAARVRFEDVYGAADAYPVPVG